MKLAVAIAGDDAPDTAFVVWRGFESSIQKAAEYGYHGVELALKEASDVDPKKLEQLLNKYDLEVSCISTGQVFASLNIYFTHPDPDVRKRVTDVFTGLIGLAKDYGQIINIGRVRGFYAKDQSKEDTEKFFVETAQRICDEADKLGVTIIIEPVNRYEINFINSVDEGAALVKKIDRPNCGLMPDVFHMNIEDAHIGESFIRNADLVKYVHLADSNRWAPGNGHLDFDEVFTSLKKAGFDGWTSIEILPFPDPDTAAKQAAEYILPRIKEYNAG